MSGKDAIITGSPHDIMKNSLQQNKNLCMWAACGYSFFASYISSLSVVICLTVIYRMLSVQQHTSSVTTHSVEIIQNMHLD